MKNFFTGTRKYILNHFRNMDDFEKRIVYFRVDDKIYFIDYSKGRAQMFLHTKEMDILIGGKINTDHEMIHLLETYPL